jgi:hypothetical protein
LLIFLLTELKWLMGIRQPITEKQNDDDLFHEWEEFAMDEQEIREARIEWEA